MNNYIVQLGYVKRGIGRTELMMDCMGLFRYLYTELDLTLEVGLNYHNQLNICELGEFHTPDVTAQFRELEVYSNMKNGYFDLHLNFKNEDRVFIETVLMKIEYWLSGEWVVGKYEVGIVEYVEEK